ncbi:MAG: CRISPR-associated protein Csx19 [Candidatus Promineifilaceae bacterium]
MSHYQRIIEKKHPASSQSLAKADLVDLKDDLIGWLTKQAKQHKLGDPCYLLVHADDGVIWGRIDKNEQLRTSYDALRDTEAQKKWDQQRIAAAKKSLPPLRIETLQQARLFTEQAELFIWKDGDGAWQGRLIKDVIDGETAAWLESFDEPQMLWGTHGTQLKYDFTLLEDGAQGLRHAVPVPLKLSNGCTRFGETTPPRLVVRHYLNKDGFAQVVVSRLVKFEIRNDAQPDGGCQSRAI